MFVNSDHQQSFELLSLCTQLQPPLQILPLLWRLLLQEFSKHSEVITRKNKKNYNVFLLLWHISSGHRWEQELDLSSRIWVPRYCPLPKWLWWQSWRPTTDADANLQRCQLHSPHLAGPPATAVQEWGSLDTVFHPAEPLPSSLLESCREGSQQLQRILSFFVFSIQVNQISDLWRNNQFICKAEMKSWLWFKLHE